MIFLKLFALFAVKAGYQGLLVFLDEGVNLIRLPISRPETATMKRS